jgi:hypothetical protein
MKKLIFLLVVMYASIDVFCQFETSDTLFKSAGAVDTTIFRVFKRSQAYIELDVSTMADNDSIDIMMSADGTWGGSVPTSGDIFPMKLTKSDHAKDVNGTIKYRIALRGDAWESKYLGIWIKCAGAAKPSIHY